MKAVDLKRKRGDTGFMLDHLYWRAAFAPRPDYREYGLTRQQASNAEKRAETLIRRLDARER